MRRHYPRWLTNSTLPLPRSCSADRIRTGSKLPVCHVFLKPSGTPFRPKTRVLWATRHPERQFRKLFSNQIPFPRTALRVGATDGRWVGPKLTIRATAHIKENEP